MQAAIAELRAWGAIAVVGAGLSVARFPLTAGLQALVWQALEAEPSAKDELTCLLDRSATTAKALVGDDPTATDVAYQVIGTFPKARRSFQQGFAELDHDRARLPSPAHEALARLIHAGLLERTISFNWDTALEHAYLRRYGVSLPVGSGRFDKPHGDAAHPERPWVLPNEPGQVDGELVQQLLRLTRQRPRVLLVVGYSERDEVVVQRLIAPLRDRWRVVRIGPTATGELAIAARADEVLPALAEALVPGPELPGWQWVSFEDQQDLGPALLGYRLGPANVRACPRLPEVSELLQRLRVARSAALVADSGSGKSVTAYQAAYELHVEGWEVVTLSDPSLGPQVVVSALRSTRWPTVAIVDDAQALPASMVRGLRAAATPERAILVVTSYGAGAGPEQVRLVEARAVAVLAEEFGRRVPEILPVVRQLDDRVGERVLDETIEHRLQQAATSERPWQFMFVLTGGHRRAGQYLLRLRDHDRSDLCLALVAAGQAVSVDAGVDRSWLERGASWLGRDSHWLDNALAMLRGQRLVLGTARLRCPHQRFAEYVLLAASRNRDDAQWPALVNVLRYCMTAEDTPLLGCSWLLDMLRSSDTLRYNAGDHQVVDDQALEILLDRCLAAPSGQDRGVAAYLMWNLTWWHPRALEAFADHADVITHWVEAATGLDAGGLAWLLGAFRQSDHQDVGQQICAAVDPTSIGELLATVTASDAYRWSRLLDEVVHAAGDDWRERFIGALPRDDLLGLAGNLRPRDWLGGFVELAESLLSIDSELALAMVRAAAPTIGAVLSSDPARAAQELFELFLFLQVPERGRRSRWRQWYQTAKALVDATDWTQAGRRISTTSRRDWQSLDILSYWLHHIDPRAWQTMAAAIQLDELDHRTAALWPGLEGDLDQLLWALSFGPDHQPARAWLTRHGNEIHRFTGRSTVIAPEVAAAGVRRGADISLGGVAGLQWTDAAEALNALASVDLEAATQAARSDREVIATGLQLRQANMIDGLEDFLSAVDAAAPGLITEILATLDPSQQEALWATRLRGSSREQRATAVLVERSLTAPGSIAQVARRLRRRFPTASRVRRSS